MKRKCIVFIAIIIIPFFILLFDHFVLHEDVKLDAYYDTSRDWKQIVEHQNEYPTSLLKLANTNKETIPFVADYLSDCQKSYSLDLTEDLKDGLPRSLQFDKRWGYKKYGNDFMAVNGCGPTCLSVVASYLKQNPTLNPYYIAKMSYQNGYYTYKGTSWKLMNEGAQKLGIHSKELPLSEKIMVDELQQDHPIICSVGPGTFTTTGHFIVLKDYQDGKFIVNDPNSIEKSHEYSFEDLGYQIKNLWSYC